MYLIPCYVINHVNHVLSFHFIKCTLINIINNNPFSFYIFYIYSTLLLRYVQSFFNMEREHTIYLTSTGNLDTFPNNNPCRFINRLAAPITLDPNYDYELGLVSILYPNEYYAVVGNQYKNKLTFYTKFHEISKLQKYSYTLQNSILAGDIEKLIYSINNEVKLRLMVYYDLRYAKVFGRGDIFYWDKYKNRVGMYYTPILHSTEVKRKGDRKCYDDSG